jgi:hypothetical protein
MRRAWETLRPGVGGRWLSQDSLHWGGTALAHRRKGQTMDDTTRVLLSTAPLTLLGVVHAKLLAGAICGDPYYLRHPLVLWGVAVAGSCALYFSL